MPESLYSYTDIGICVLACRGQQVLGVTASQALQLIELPHDNARDALWYRWLEESRTRNGES